MLLNYFESFDYVISYTCMYVALIHRYTIASYILQYYEAIYIIKCASTGVLDRHENLWLPQKTVSREQPDNNIFFQHAAIKSIGMMLLVP